MFQFCPFDYSVCYHYEWFSNLPMEKQSFFFHQFRSNHIWCWTLHFDMKLNHVSWNRGLKKGFFSKLCNSRLPIATAFSCIFLLAFGWAKGDECKLVPVKHVLEHPGCEAKQFASFACVGKCTSYVQESGFL